MSKKNENMDFSGLVEAVTNRYSQNSRCKICLKFLEKYFGEVCLK